jgi:MFS family permease
MQRKWWTLLAVSVATFMLLLDITVVNVALPSIRQDLGGSFTDLQWVVDAYPLTLAALVLRCGWSWRRLAWRWCWWSRAWSTPSCTSWPPPWCPATTGPLGPTGRSGLGVWGSRSAAAGPPCRWTASR